MARVFRGEGVPVVDGAVLSEPNRDDHVLCRDRAVRTVRICRRYFELFLRHPYCVEDSRRGANNLCRRIAYQRDHFLLRYHAVTFMGDLVPLDFSE